jgi:predicted HAD superfamily Cof-like phosphohydrolase
VTLVREFHEAFGLPAPDTTPLYPDPALLRLRIRLIREEVEEAVDELEALVYEKDANSVQRRLLALLKELADLRYVTDGCAVALGLNIDAAFKEVHRSNMSKLGADGRPIYREDGKVLKGPNYSEADLTRIVPEIIDHKED